MAIILITPLWQRGSHYSSLWQREVGRDFIKIFNSIVVLVLHPLYIEFNKAGAIKRLLRFHHFKPSFNGFLYICECLFTGFPLRKTARNCRNLCYKIPRFIPFNAHMQFHLIFISLFLTLTKLWKSRTNVERDYEVVFFPLSPHLPISDSISSGRTRNTNHGHAYFHAPCLNNSPSPLMPACR